MYSSVAIVREISGFSNTTKISNGMIRRFIALADSMIDGAIAYRYTMPMVHRKEGILTFSGTGSGTGSFVVTINGTAYTMSVTNGMTASQVADLFRAEAEDNEDFYLDFIGDGAEVRIVSKTDTTTNETTPTAEVTVTSAPTAVGISLASSVLDYYPGMMRQLSADIATALLYQNQYGKESEDTPTDGYAKMEVLQQILDQIAGIDPEKTPIRILDDYTKIELSTSLNDLPRGLPNASTNGSTDNDTTPFVSINSIF